MHSLITEAAKEGRSEVIQAVLPAILTVASQEELDALQRNLAFLLKHDVDEASLKAIFSLIPPSADTALSYIDERLLAPALERSMLDLMVGALGDAAPSAMLSALFKGEADLAMSIHSANLDRFPCQVSILHGLHINDYPVECRSEEMTGFSSRKDVKKCFELFADPAIFLPHDGVNLGLYWALDESKQKHSLEACTTGYQGAIPKLVNGVLQAPELALALSDVMAESAFPEAYAWFPAWVSKEDVQSQSDAVFFEPVIKSVWGDKKSIYWGLEDYETIRSVDFTNRGGSSVTTGIRALEDITIGLKPSSADEQEGYTHLRYLEHFVDDKTLLGLAHEPDHVLALLPVLATQQMALGKVSADALSQAYDFAQDFFPLDRLINLQQEKSRAVSRVAHKQIFHAYGPINLLKTVFTSPYCVDLLARLPKKMLMDAFDFAGHTAGPEAVIGMRNVYSQKLPIVKLADEFDADALGQLSGAHYSLWIDQSKGIRRPVKSGEGAANVQGYKTILDLGGWPVGMPEYTIKEALRVLVKDNGKSMAEAFLLHQGMPAVLKEARTPGEWKVFMAIFPSNEVRSVMQEIPEKHRNEFFSADLGL